MKIPRIVSVLCQDLTARILAEIQSGSVHDQELKYISEIITDLCIVSKGTNMKELHQVRTKLPGGTCSNLFVMQSAVCLQLLAAFRCYDELEREHQRKHHKGLPYNKKNLIASARRYLDAKSEK